MALMVSVAWASEGTWTFAWNKSKADGGEGFYHISNNTDTIQEATLNGLAWTYQGNTSVTAYTASAGQYFGSAKSPCIHGTLTTGSLKGKVKEVRLETKKKDAAQDVRFAITVGGVSYLSEGDVTATTGTDWSTCTFVPAADAAEGTIVIDMAQLSETVGIIYFRSMTIVYDGEGPVVEKVKPGLAYAVQDVTVEAGDNAYANYLTNPKGVSPITYKAADETIAVIGSNGNIFTIGKVGTTLVSAYFAGNDTYLPDTASYTLHVVAKPVIAAPGVSPMGGTFTEPVRVTISSDDALCKAIWYSITAQDSIELIEDPIIEPGQRVTITLDQSCTLRCCAVGDNNIGCVAEVSYDINVPLKADFSAEESSKVYYEMGWDSVEEASTWHYYGIHPSNYWTLTASPTLSGTQSFSTIDPKSQYSLSIMYAETPQRERAVSPQVEVKPNSVVEFYACFSGVWLVYADWSLIVNDVTDSISTTLVSGFDWAQKYGFTGPNWVKFSYDLEQFAGHTCTFEFLYEGTGGDDMSIDGFKLLQQDNSADAKITIMKGQSVHFQDLSAGHPTSWAWTFEGADVTTSDKQNPVVTYSQEGTYGVKLTVGKDGQTDTCNKEDYVVVVVEAPTAHIGLPEGAYLSPWAAAFVPVCVPVTFTDASQGAPTSWAWTFEGTDVANSTEQNPTVTYLQEGLYGLTLDVQNAAGKDHDFLVNAIQAGGSTDVWNITPEESGSVAEVTLAWYGSYAGSNWLGMEAFAEHFDAPLTTVTVDKVTAYFAATEADNQDALVTVSLCLPDADGMPGQVLAESSLKVSELACDAYDVVPTDFTFDAPVDLDSEFFITISGFPNTGYSDNVALLCAYRGQGGKTTTLHLLEDEDANYNPLGTYTWYVNEDEPLSLALTAHMAYNSVTSLQGVNGAADGMLRVYDLMGRMVRLGDAKSLPAGSYLIQQGSHARIVEVK